MFIRMIDRRGGSRREASPPRAESAEGRLFKFPQGVFEENPDAKRHDQAKSKTSQDESRFGVHDGLPPRFRLLDGSVSSAVPVGIDLLIVTSRRFNRKEWRQAITEGVPPAASRAVAKTNQGGLSVILTMPQVIMLRHVTNARIAKHEMIVRDRSRSRSESALILANSTSSRVFGHAIRSLSPSDAVSVK